MTDAYEAEVIITPKPYDPSKDAPLFCCAICSREVMPPRWFKRDGRSREIAPICLHCEQAYGGTNLSSWVGVYRMDARLTRRVKAAAVYLSCLVARKKQGW